MGEPRRTDAELIGESLDDPDVFRTIFSRHFDPIFRFAARRVGRDTAGDVASEVFTRAFRLRRRYDLSRADSLPWLYGIATNVVGDRLRAEQRSSRTYLAIGVPEEQWADVDDRVVAQSMGETINGALETLSIEDRETFLLFALEGLSYEEVGEALGVPAGTVGSRIFRVRRTIREAIPDLEQIAGRMGNQPEDGGSV